MSKQPEEIKVVVMGGGTGIFPVISALIHLDIDISSIVAVSDSGGSTARLRDEFGFQPVGDLRQSLAALAEKDGQEWIRKLLLYRFSKGNGLMGHNLGNLILTALQDMTGDTTEALDIASKIFRLGGRVIPVTKENVMLKINYDNGESVIGEHVLDEKRDEYPTITSIELDPPARLSEHAHQAITQADWIIIGPGDYYASLMAVLVPGGIKEAFQATQAKVLYAVNLMTRRSQTDDMTAREHVEGIEAAIGRPLDVVLINKEEIPQAALALYAEEQEYPVTDDLETDSRVRRESLINTTPAQQSAADAVPRSLIRHDSAKLKLVLDQLIRQSV